MFCIRDLFLVSLDIQLFKGRQRYKKLRSLSSVNLLKCDLLFFLTFHGFQFELISELQTKIPNSCCTKEQ